MPVNNVSHTKSKEESITFYISALLYQSGGKFCLEGIGNVGATY